MHIVSLRFLLLIAVGLVLFHAFPYRNWRRIILLGLNATFIFSYAGSPTELVPLFVFLLLFFVFIRAVQIRPSRALFVCGFVTLVCAFVYLKQYPFTRFIPSLGIPYAIVGLSYIFFRLLQVFVDAYQGSITERISIWRMFNFSCFFLAFVSGPIQRFQEYRAQEDTLDKISISQEQVYAAFSRIANGCIKIALLSAFCNGILAEGRRLMGDNPVGQWLVVGFVVVCTAYLLNMYINFSGYMDVVIGVGVLFGFDLPENFNWPLSSANLLDLWRRWHITLGEWFKVYVFNPLVKALGHRFKDPAMIPAHGVIAYFVTFFIIGVWHQATLGLVLYGILIGYGVSFNKLYEVEMRKRIGKKRFAKLRENPLYSTCANGFTVAYFAVTLTCLWMDLGDMKHLALTLGLGGIAECLGVMTAGTMLIKFACDVLRKCAHPLERSYEHLSQAFLFRQFGLAFRVFALTLIFFNSVSNIPEIVYKGF